MAKFAVETRKTVTGYSWVNTWHVESVDMSNAIAASLLIAQFEARIMWEGARVFEVKTSEWPNPSGIYFVVTPTFLEGERILSLPAPAEACVLGDIGTTIGRKGRKWFRYCLSQGEYRNSGQYAVLTSDSTIQADYDDAADILHTALIGNGSTLLVGGEPEAARSSTNVLTLRGVGFRDPDVGWYNHTT